MNTILKHLRQQNQTTWLIYAFIAVFVIGNLLGLIFKINLSNYLCLNTVQTPFYPPFWTWFTYAWLHNDIVHLLMNCVGVYAISIIYQTYLPRYSVIKQFMIGSVLVGIVYQLLIFLDWQHAAVIGASAGIMYLFFTAVGLQPHGQVRIPLIGIVKLWHIGLFFVLFDVLMIFINLNRGGSVTHLLGAVAGFIYGFVVLGKNEITLNFQKTKKHLKTKKSQNKTFKQWVKEDKTQQQIDEILDKINKSGYESLTEEEKQFLFKQK